MHVGQQRVTICALKLQGGRPKSNHTYIRRFHDEGTDVGFFRQNCVWYMAKIHDLVARARLSDRRDIIDLDLPTEIKELVWEFAHPGMGPLYPSVQGGTRRRMRYM